MSVTSLPVAASHGHRVQFYTADLELAHAVSAFLAPALRGGGAAVVIATPAHAAPIRAALTAMGLREDHLILLDAEATLAQCLDGDAATWARFSAAIGSVLERAAASGGPVRAYGEMVDVLWRAGKRSTALELEELWNAMAAHHTFDLLCGYGNDIVDSVSAARDICSVHSHVAPPLASDQMTEVQAFIGEASRRSYAEANLRERTDDLVDFLENAAVAIHRVDANGIIRWANRTELALLGYTQDEYIGHHIAEFHADRPVIDDILARLLRGDTICDYEARLRHKDGSIRHVAISSNLQKRPGGTTRCFARDITAQKRAEAEREAASRAKDEFLAVLGHELRNPLSPILTAVQLMRLRGETTSAREQDIIERQVNHLVHLVDDLLDISRIARGKVDLTMRPVKLAPLVTKALEVAGPLCEERRHRVELSLPDGDIWIDADDTRICQVLVNLVTNAAKYTERGGKIDVKVTRSADRVRVAVADSGVGIAPDLLPAIFEPFVQGPRSTERSRGGLGIGLAIVRNLVTLHGGTVTASSAGPGRGSEFVIELPVVEIAQVVDSTPPEPPAVAAKVTPRRILVVDDNEDAGELLAEMLRSAGHDVHVAIDGPRALERIAHFRPDVAILDIGLPVMDGYELATEIRARLGTAVTLLAVTGYGQDRDRVRAERAGFRAHFVKPIGFSKLLAGIEAETGR